VPDSLKLLPDPKLEQHIQTLERQLQAQNQAQAQAQLETQNQAQRLRSEGEALQKQNRIREAIGKYRDSLRYLPDPKLEQHIASLERSLQAPAPPVQPPVRPPIDGRSYTAEPVQPQTAPKPAHWDGSYAGQFMGAATGTLRFVVQAGSVQGQITGTTDGDGVSASLSGRVDAAGHLQAQVSGYVRWRLSASDKLNEMPFAGTLSGTLSGRAGSGKWAAQSGQDQRAGNWSVSR